MKKRLLAILVLASLVVVAGCAAAPKLELPQGAQKLSDVVPAMGEHWANPAQLPLGPLYLVHKGEVIGMEYMWTEDMMQRVSVPPPAVPELGEFTNNLVPLPIGVVIDHADVAFMPKGHEGFEVPHWDTHLWFVTHEEHMAIRPGG